MNAAEIEELQEGLSDARNYLLEQPAQKIVDCLARVLDEFRDPQSAARITLCGELPTAAGFSPEATRAGLARGLETWSGAALHQLIERELGALASLDQTSPCMVSGFDTTAVVLAGAIPMPTILALLAPLVLRSPVLAKVSAHDPVTPRVFAKTLSAIDPGLGSCVQTVQFASQDREALAAFLTAPCVVASGSDETIQSIANHLRPTQRFVGYGHRVSFAVLGPEATLEKNLARIASGIALDVALWDQLGCLSPSGVYFLNDDLDLADRLANAIAQALRKAEGEWPRGRIASETAAQIAQERAEAEMRSAAGSPVRVYSSSGTSWTVIREADTAPRKNPLHRFLRVHPVHDITQLKQVLLPFAPHLAAVALDGFGAQTAAVARLLAELGASRICPPGAMQSPPLAWHHDNRGVLTPLARFTDLES